MKKRRLNKGKDITLNAKAPANKAGRPKLTAIAKGKLTAHPYQKKGAKV